jgi:hypothetical protein
MLISYSGMIVITLMVNPGMVITMAPECFPQRGSGAGNHKRQAVFRREATEKQIAN